MSRRRKCVVTLLTAALAVTLAGPVSASQDGRAPAALKKVHFAYTPAGRHSQVALAGTFNGWSTDATPMRLEGGRWVATLLLPAGEYEYKFVADGEWITDGKAEKFEPDGYGGRNSVIVVDDSFESVVMRRGDGSIVTADLGHGDAAWERSLGHGGGARLRVRAYTGDVERV